MNANIKMENNQALSITVDDGMQEVPINNKFGRQIGVFYFRPTDINIIDRYNSIVDKVPEVFKPLEDINIDANGTTEEASMGVIKEAEDKLFELCDYLFDGNLSEAFFGSMNPFSPLANGTFYCEQALEMVGNFIASQFQGNIKSLEKRVSKYTKGYGSKPGKHRPS